MMIFYRFGIWNGIRGYYISTEYSDERFWFGTLEEIKKKPPFCAYGERAQWIDFSGRQ